MPPLSVFVRFNKTERHMDECRVVSLFSFPLLLELLVVIKGKHSREGLETAACSVPIHYTSTSPVRINERRSWQTTVRLCDVTLCTCKAHLRPERLERLEKDLFRPLTLTHSRRFETLPR